MWAYLTKYYAGGPELTAAWGFVGAAQPLAQVLFSLVPRAALQQQSSTFPVTFWGRPEHSYGSLSQQSGPSQSLKHFKHGLPVFSFADLS